MSDVSPDILDRASELTMRMNDSLVAAAQRLARPEQVKVDGKWPIKDCDDCGNEIPEARLNLAKIRCIYCQERVEMRRAGR